MMKNEIVKMILVFVTGVFLGAIFFGGLLLTVGSCMQSRLLVLWFMASMVLRTGIVLAGFYLVCGGHLDRFLLCLLGFIVARIIIKKIILMSKKTTTLILESGHAS
jgi:F1F0 ATPase subunit 2